MPRSAPNLSFPEFVTLLALMVSIMAMSTDIMLPALGVIAVDLGVENGNDAQLVVSSLFMGFAVGLLVVGPLSDSFGRKPVIYAGYVIFVLGCLVSLLATDLTAMVIGRVLQGIGAAAPRIVTISLVRDCYEGRAMARLMSIVMSIFILVPALAPAIGQGIVALSGWRQTFLFLLALAVLAFVWFGLRQQETLAAADRRSFSLGSIARGIVEALSSRTVVGYTLAAGLLFGAFVGYLSSAQQVFQVAFGTGPLFPLYFAIAALAIGSASILNAMLVMRLGMRLLTRCGLIGVTCVSGVFLAVVLAAQGLPPLWAFMVWLVATFFGMGILFGNINALAMEPLGYMAGLGASLIGAISTLLSLPIGWFIGSRFDGGVTALVSGFLATGLAAFIVMLWTERQFPFALRQGTD